MAGFVLVLFLLAIGPMGCGPSGQSQAPTPGEVTITPTAATTKPAASPSPTEQISQVPVIKSSQGRRDPFVPVVFPPRVTEKKPPSMVPPELPEGRRGPGDRKQDIVVLPQMKVTGIVRMGGSYFASVTGVKNTSLTVGDSVDTFKVKYITEKKVVLTKSGKEYPFVLQHPDEKSSEGGRGLESGGPGSTGPGAPPPPVPAP
jgi:hypothetical protein